MEEIKVEQDANKLHHAEIKHVNVYNNVVLIDKVFECELQPGENHVEVGYFPLRIHDTTLRL